MCLHISRPLNCWFCMSCPFYFVSTQQNPIQLQQSAVLHSACLIQSECSSVTQRCDASGFGRREGRHPCDVMSPLRGRLSVSSPPEVQLHIGIICGNCLKRGGRGPSPHSRIRKSGLGPQQLPGRPLHTPRSQCPQFACALSPVETAHPAPTPSAGSDKAH